jgi:hypothetical protein
MNGKRATISWIPERYAKKGKYLKLKGEDGWKVVSVSNLRMPEDLVKERSQDYKHQREASDI